MTRAPAFRASFLRPQDMVVDLFAGAGGASLGIEAALGRPVDIAINHSRIALDVHQKNHPETRHIQSDVWEVDPREVCGSRKVGFLWASPDCKHFSKAKGTKPLSARVRSLAWVVVRWAQTVKPRVIVVENVEEFATWGPLDENGRPRADKIGRTFRAWLGRMSDLGYTADHRVLSAADYGTPTIRKRLFIVFVRTSDRRPIVWPEATHGPGRSPFRTAAGCIDWTIPCPSIFNRRRPLAEATQRRIAAGIRRYVVDAQPFILPVTHQADRSHGVGEPLRTVTGAHRGEFALCTPFVVRHGHYSTITGAGLVEGCGAGTFRGQPLTAPLSTVCATDDRHLVVPVMIKHYGNGVVGHAVNRPLGTVTAKDHHSLAAAWLTKFYGSATHGASLTAPMPTVTTGGGRGGGHAGLVHAFLMKYHGGARGHTRGQPLAAPIRTLDTANRFGLVMIQGEPWQIEDIGMRMLAPEELKRAQGFPGWYDLSPARTKTNAIKLIGNSVCEEVAEAIIVSNVGRAPDQLRLFRPAREVA